MSDRPPDTATRTPDGAPDGAARRPERPGAAQWVPAGASVEQLRAAAAACRGCELWEPATQVVFSAGAVDGRLALVGEQPGDQEDRRGVPFVGPAGRLLQRAVAEAGIDLATTYVTNAVKHFRFSQEAPGRRRIHASPDVAHVAACRPWLAAELAQVDPDVVVCLGATAAKALLPKDFRVTKHRGQLIRRVTSRGEKTFLGTIHPSAVLRVPEAERERAYAALVADLRVAAGALG
ncbi:UdgX family uracil-DNA binding protein [Paenibacillus sp. TRM 82003]|nr:UdgX family uracil-DNA binding protein [Kineococcus sp. TRM81007]MCI2240362.1 UdgX family uracil-DNA binding protein [Kineococcus sp. TRM81007]MCI3927461.1 UdgX family uracil-DNA binding protein [Paenibacillus sp. TRM 82003]